MTLSVRLFLLCGAAVLLPSGCREARLPEPLRRPVAEREYRQVEALEWMARSGSGEEFTPFLNWISRSGK